MQKTDPDHLFAPVFLFRLRVFVVLAPAVVFRRLRQVCKVVLGVPGLVDAYRAGNVSLANAPGNGVADGITISGSGTPVLTLTGTVADPRIILKKALESEAVALILCHNHPSGNLKPSRADEELTRKIRDAALLLDIRILDHIIVSDRGYFSFADEGFL